jgi:hypothetical protein
MSGGSFDTYSAVPLDEAACPGHPHGRHIVAYMPGSGVRVSLPTHPTTRVMMNTTAGICSVDECCLLSSKVRQAEERSSAALIENTWVNSKETRSMDGRRHKTGYATITWKPKVIIGKSGARYH